MEEVKLKWCEILEDLLQCNVCLEVPRTSVLQCTIGHHICIFCRTRIEKCPICKSEFTQTRNFPVEQLANRFEEMKLAILEKDTKTECLKNIVSVFTQTDFDVIKKSSSGTQTNDTQIVEREQKVPPAPLIAKGLFPCRLGSCTVELPYGRLIGHIKHHHEDKFYETTQKTFSFSLKLTRPQIHDHVVHIRNMGLFFIYMTINSNRDFLTGVQIVNCIDTSRLFEYELVIGSNALRYHGQITSCRIPIDSTRRFHLKEQKILSLGYDSVFNCTLTILRKQLNEKHKLPV